MSAEGRQRASGPSFAPPWQFVLRAALIISGLAMLLIVEVHGAAFYLAWSLIVVALMSEGAATPVHLRRSRRRRA